MSTVILQLGQCGNQLGYDLLSVLSDELLLPEGSSAGPQGSNAFFRERLDGSYTPRALLLDMEPKVVQRCITRSRAARSRWQYSPDNAVVQQSGSGNNWALGYHLHGGNCAADVVECARREAEACDHFGGFLLLQSLAGGTGAGFGSRVAAELYDAMPSALRLSYAIWPYDSGEVMVQAYNTLLSVQSLLETCDGLVLVRNEDLHATCETVHNNTRPGFKDLNAVAAHSLGALLCPARHRATSPSSPAPPGPHLSDPRTPPTAKMSPGMHEAQANSAGVLSRIPEDLGRRMTMGDILQQVASHPAYRVLTLRSVPHIAPSAVPYTTFHWNAILKRLLQCFITRTTCPDRLDWSRDATASPLPHRLRGSSNMSAGSYLVLRGTLAAQADASALAASHFFPSWHPHPLSVAAGTRTYQKYDMSSTLLSSDQSCEEPLSMAAFKCTAMLQAGAFVHQYEVHGMGKDDLWQAMQAAQEVVSAYQVL